MVAVRDIQAFSTFFGAVLAVLVKMADVWCLVSESMAYSRPRGNGAPWVEFQQEEKGKP